MAQVLLFTSPNFRGTITATPSGKAYYVVPGQTVVAEDVDVPLLLSYGFSPAAPSAAGGGGGAVGPAGSFQLTDGSGTFVASFSSDDASGGALNFADGNAQIHDILGASLELNVGGVQLYNADSSATMTFGSAGAGFIAFKAGVSAGGISFFISGLPTFALNDDGSVSYGVPTGPAAVSGDINIAAAYKVNGIAIVGAPDAAGAQAGTVANAPTAGDPAAFIRVLASDGTVYAVPGWAIP